MGCTAQAVKLPVWYNPLLYGRPHWGACVTRKNPPTFFSKKFVQCTLNKNLTEDFYEKK